MNRKDKSCFKVTSSSYYKVYISLRRLKAGKDFFKATEVTLMFASAEDCSLLRMWPCRSRACLGPCLWATLWSSGEMVGDRFSLDISYLEPV